MDDSGALMRKHFLQLDGLGVRDLHFCGDDLYILAGPTMVLNGDIRIFKWPAARPFLAANRAEAICNVPLTLSGGKSSWLVLYDAPGDDRKEGEHTAFGDLLRHK